MMSEMPTTEVEMREFLRNTRLGKAHCAKLYDVTERTIYRWIKKCEKRLEERDFEPSVAPVSSSERRQTTDTAGVSVDTEPTRFDPRKVMMSLAVEGSFQAARYLIENPFTNVSEGLTVIDPMPRWGVIRRDCKQRDLFLAAISGSLCVVGVRGSGKTVTLEDAMAYEILTRDRPLEVAIFSGKADTAKKRVQMISRQLRQRGFNQFETNSATKFELRDGTSVKSYALTLADVHSDRADLMWMDEAQLIPEELMESIIGLFSGKTNIRLWVTGNALRSNDSPFERLVTNEDTDFRQAVQQVLALHYFAFEEADIYWTSDKDKEAVKLLLRTLGSEDAVEVEMSNKFVRASGSYYDTESIQWAYRPVVTPNAEQFDLIVCGVDWGSAHDTAFVTLGVMTNPLECYELELTTHQHPSITQLLTYHNQLIQKYPNITFLWETSPSGSHTRQSIRDAAEDSGMDTTRFKKSNFSHHKERFIDALYTLLMEKRLHFHNDRLKRELLGYDGSKKNDDRHDALLHALYYVKRYRRHKKHNRIASIFG